MTQVEDKCKSCKYLNPYDWECKKDYYLDSTKFTIECEDWEEEEKE